MIEENFSLKANKYLTRHYLHVFILVMVGLSVALYFFLLSMEERNNEELLRMQKPSASKRTTSALSASQLVETGKPFLMYGTAWKKEETAEYVQQAVEAGFRFIDTACQPKHYNEPLVGEGWVAGAAAMGLEREGTVTGDCVLV